MDSRFRANCGRLAAFFPLRLIHDDPWLSSTSSLSTYCRYGKPMGVFVGKDLTVIVTPPPKKKGTVAVWYVAILEIITCALPHICKTWVDTSEQLEPRGNACLFPDFQEPHFHLPVLFRKLHSMASFGMTRIVGWHCSPDDVVIAGPVVSHCQNRCLFNWGLLCKGVSCG